MKVLLTGGAGSVGYYTLLELLKQNHEVTLLDLKNKRTTKKLKKFKNKINIIWGDVRNYELMESLIRGKDAVIHLAAIIPPLSDTSHELTKEVNFGGTKNIVDAISKVNKNCFLLFSSSISIYGDRLKNYNIKVTDPLIKEGKDYYASMKKEAEKYIVESNINYSIFRLTAIMDKPKPNPLMFHMPLETKLEISTGKDTGIALVNSLNHIKELNKKIFNLGGGFKSRTIYKDFLKESFKRMGLNYKYLNEDYFAKSDFHCGYYIDGDKLNDIINFQNDTLEDYYNYLEKNVNLIQKTITKLLSKQIVKKINNSSEFKK